MKFSDDMKNLAKKYWWLIPLAVAFAFSGSKEDSPEKKERMQQNAIESDRKFNELVSCISIGKKYYQELGSWPKLHSTGENAADVVKRRCETTTTAF